MQIPHASVGEVMGRSGYDWVALDLEHGAIGIQQLPDLCRALELGGTLPLARLAASQAGDCARVLDAGVGGVIAANVQSAGQLLSIRDACRWPPAGMRSVGFSRANLFGASFDAYALEAQAPLLVAMIEHQRAVQELPAIVEVEGLDAILIGPYDLSASLGRTGSLSHPEVQAVVSRILEITRGARIACGTHIVAPSPSELQRCHTAGFRFFAYGIDSVILQKGAVRPQLS